MSRHEVPGRGRGAPVGLGRGRLGAGGQVVLGGTGSGRAGENAGGGGRIRSRVHVLPSPADNCRTVDVVCSGRSFGARIWPRSLGPGGFQSRVPVRRARGARGDAASSDARRALAGGGARGSRAGAGSPGDRARALGTWQRIPAARAAGGARGGRAELEQRSARASSVICSVVEVNRELGNVLAGGSPGRAGVAFRPAQRSLIRCPAGCHPRAGAHGFRSRWAARVLLLSRRDVG